MKAVRAADLRKSLSRVAKSLERTGDPVALTMRGKVVGVLISVRDWNERFTARAAAEERRRLIAEILADQRPPSRLSVDEVVAELRAR